MQSPTPPTKPTPPTPPSMKISTGTTSTTPSSPVTTIPQSSVSSKTPTITKEQSTPAAAVPESTNTPPPVAAIGAGANTATEKSSAIGTSGETGIVAAAPGGKNSSAPAGFSVFFVLIFIIGMGFIAVHWWKNHQPKRKAIVDYSTESSDEIVNLIFSQQSFEATPPVLPKKLAKKIVPKTESTPKTKGHFEVRV